MITITILSTVFTLLCFVGFVLLDVFVVGAIGLFVIPFALFIALPLLPIIFALVM